MMSALPLQSKYFAAFLINIVRKLWNSHSCADGQSLWTDFHDNLKNTL